MLELLKKINIKKYLNKFNKDNFKYFFKKHRNTLIIVGVILLVGLISVRLSFAFFTGTSASNIISGRLGDVTNPDVNFKFMIENLNADGSGTGSYSISYSAPKKGYTYNTTKSNCTLGSYTKNEDGTFTINSTGKTKCEIYYDSDGTLNYSDDVELNIMKEVKSVLCTGTCGYKKVTDYNTTGLLNDGYAFDSTLSTCTNGATLSFDSLNNKLNVSSTSKTVCNAYFTLGPVIKSLTSSSTQTSITVSPNFNDRNKYNASTYYYSSDGGNNYTSSTNSSYTFSSLTGGTEYTISVYATSSDGRKSNVYQEKISTSYVYAGTYAYTGGVQTYTAGANGNYKLQVWGAQGGYRSSSTYGGLGGYSIGTVYLTKGTNVYIYVGGSGNTGGTSGGFNGGGKRSTYAGGGGASDIRLGADSLYARVIVAGGGGSDGATAKKGMYGGGTTGGTTTESYTTYSTYCGVGGNQNYSGYSAAYTAASQSATVTGSGTDYYGGFGFGGNGTNYASGYGGAGGGGWYGGAGTIPDGSGDDDRGGGGGSGYIYTSSTASSCPTGCLLTSTYYLSNASTNAGNTTFESTSGSTETGHTGNGYAKITYMGS